MSEKHMHTQHKLKEKRNQEREKKQADAESSKPRATVSGDLMSCGEPGVRGQ